MKTKIIGKKTFVQLDQELASLRSFVIGLAGRDKEGEYRPEFVKRILKTSQSITAGSFSIAKNFLRELGK